MSRTVNRISVIGINYRPEVTGIAPYTSALAEGLARSGYEVEATTGYPHYPAWEIAPGYHGLTSREVIDGVDITRLRQYTPSNPTLARRVLMELSFGIRAAFTVSRSSDVVICVSPSLISTWLTIMRSKCRKRRPKLIIWVQDIYGSAAEETSVASRVARLVRLLEKRTLHAADAVVVIHERFEKQLVDQLGIPAQAITIVRNWSHGVPGVIDSRAHARSRHGWGEELIVLHAGNMGVKQGLISVIEAARQASNQNSEIKFVFLGDGNQRRYLQTEASGLPNVQFIGTLSEKDFRSALCAADILLVNELPALRDMSVPSKLTSYFSTGVPVLAATDPLSATAEEISRSQGGLRIDPGNVSELLNNIERLRTDKDLVQSITQAALEYYSQHFQRDAAIARFRELIEGLSVQFPDTD